MVEYRMSNWAVILEFDKETRNLGVDIYDHKAALGLGDYVPDPEVGPLEEWGLRVPEDKKIIRGYGFDDAIRELDGDKKTGRDSDALIMDIVATFDTVDFFM